jgi:hypothetical protein
MESPKTVQNWSTNILALTIKALYERIQKERFLMGNVMI